MTEVAGSPAALSRRAAAGCLNSVPLATMGAIGVLRARRRSRAPRGSNLGGAIEVASLAGRAALWARWGATPGQQLMGIRTVNARSGNDITFLQGLIWGVVLSAPSLLQVAMGERTSVKRRSQRIRERVAGLEREVAELQERYGDDRAGFYQACSELYQEHGLNPWEACADPAMIASILYSVAIYLPAVVSARRQCFHDRIAGVAVVRVR